MHTQMPPAPRSRQIADAQAAAAAGLPAQLPPPRPAPTTPNTLPSGRYASFPVGAPPHHPQHLPVGGRNPGVPPTKTRMCRNFKLGNACPFEDRCVFAHGDDQLVSSDQYGSPMSQTYGSMGSTDFAAAQAGAYAATTSHDATPVNSYIFDGSVEDFAAGSAAPPSYAAFVTTDPTSSGPGNATGGDSQLDSPATPVRYRHDPYSFDGFVVKYL